MTAASSKRFWRLWRRVNAKASKQGAKHVWRNKKAYGAGAALGVAGLYGAKKGVELSNYNPNFHRINKMDKRLKEIAKKQKQSGL